MFGEGREPVRQKRSRGGLAAVRVSRIVERVLGRVVGVDRDAVDGQQRLVDVGVVVVEVILIVEDPGAAANGRPAIRGRRPDEAEARLDVVQIALHLGQRRRAAVVLHEPLVVGVDQLVADLDRVVDVVADAEVQRQVVAHLPRVLREDRRVPRRLEILGGADREAQLKRIAGRIVDVEHAIGPEGPAALLRGVDVHEEADPRELGADLELVLALHIHEVVDDVEVVLAFEPAGRRRPERRARVGLLGRERLVGGVLQEREPVLPGRVPRDDQLVHAVVRAQLVERVGAERAREVAEHRPQRPVERRALLQRRERAAVAAVAALAAAVRVGAEGPAVSERQPVVLAFRFASTFAHVHPARVLRGDDRGVPLIDPVLGDRQDRVLGVVVVLDAAEEEHLVLDDRTAQKAADAVVVVRRRRVEEHRLAVGEAAGERRAIELRVAVEPVRAPLSVFAPLRVMTLSTPPVACPNSAEKPLVITWNSCTQSCGIRLGLRAVELLRVGRAVHEDLVLELALARGAESHGTAAARRDAGRQLRQAREVAVDGRQVVDLLPADHAAQGALRLDDGRLPLHFHRLGDAAHAQREVGGRLLADAQRQRPLAGRRSPATRRSPRRCRPAGSARRTVLSRWSRRCASCSFRSAAPSRWRRAARRPVGRRPFLEGSQSWSGPPPGPSCRASPQRSPPPVSTVLVRPCTASLSHWTRYQSSGPMAAHGRSSATTGRGRFRGNLTLLRSWKS